MIGSTADWDAGNAATLRAALSAVEDWDGDLSGLFGFVSDYSSGSDVSRPKKPRTRPYEKRKQEIAALRAEVEDLQNIIALEKVLAGDTITRKQSTMEAAALKLEWERLASTQKHQRFITEQENVRLRKLLQSQLKNAEKICRLTKRVRLLEEAIPQKEVPSFDDFHMPYINPGAQLQRLISLVQCTEEIFSSGGFAAEGHQCHRHLRFRGSTPAVKGADLDIEAAWVLPFAVDRVVDALWLQTIRPSFKRKRVAFKDLYEDKSSLVSQFIYSQHSEEEWHATQGQMAAKRFPPDPIDGSILIGFTTAVRVYVGANWAASGDADGWLHIQSIVSKDNTNANAEPLTQIKWHRRAIIGPPESSDMTTTQRCKWTNAIVTGPSRSRFEEDLDWSLQAIENLLLTPKEKNVVGDRCVRSYD